MTALSYFKDLDNDFLLAYEKKSEFFVRYIPKTDEWEYCNISFSSFRHDYCFKEVSEEEARRMTNGNLPMTLLGDYLALISKNTGN